MTDRRELYCSPNGDCWFLAQEPGTDHAFIIHQANQPSGGQRSRIDLATFLRHETKGPEQQALLRLIGTLVVAAPAANDPQ